MRYDFTVISFKGPISYRLISSLGLKSHKCSGDKLSSAPEARAQLWTEEAPCSRRRPSRPPRHGSWSSSSSALIPYAQVGSTKLPTPFRSLSHTSHATLWTHAGAPINPTVGDQGEEGPQPRARVAAARLVSLHCNLSSYSAARPAACRPHMSSAMCRHDLTTSAFSYPIAPCSPL